MGISNTGGRAKPSQSLGETMDADSVIKFLDFISRSDTVLLCAIEVDGPVRTDAFLIRDKAAIRKWLSAHSKRNLYYHVNPVPHPREDEKGRPQKALKTDVPEVHFFHIDIDPPEGKRGDEEWIAATIDRLNNFRLPPSAIVYSGNGVQALWALDTPIKINGEKEADEAARYNWELARLLDGDGPTRDISRVLRLPGSTNYPTKKKREKGYPVSQSRIVSLHPDRTYAPSQFDKIDPGHMRSEAKGKKEGAGPVNLKSVDLSEVKGEVGDLEAIPGLKGKKRDRLRRMIAEKCEVGTDRSKKVWNVINAMVRVDVADADIARIMLDPKWGISAHILEQRNPRNYCARQIAKAREAVKDWVTGENGIVANHQDNIATALRKLGFSLSYNQFSGVNTVSENEEPSRNLDDAEVIRMWLLVDKEFGFRPSKEFFFDVVGNLARENGTHPVREYLDGLEWDGKKRLDGWLSKYSGAKDDPYTRAVGRLLMIAAVRRIRLPGAKFDEMVVLESEQGMNKSSALAALAVRDEWFSDDLPLNADSKMVIERTQGKWIIEASELKGMRKGEVEHLKSFLSRRTDRARLAYGHISTEVPRQFVVVGSTNSDKYLRDPSGNRRFWPVRIGRFDVDGLIEAREQLWAEASHLEKKGEKIRLDPALWAAAAKEQEERAAEDPWEIAMVHALSGRVGKIAIRDCWTIVGMTTAQRSQEHNVRLGETMRALGWERVQLRAQGHRMYFFVKGNGVERERIILARMSEGEREATVYYEDMAAETAHRETSSKGAKDAAI